MTWLRVIISVVVDGVDDDIVDYVLGDVGPDVVVAGASLVLGGEDDDVVAVVGTVVVNDVDGGVASPVEVGGVVDVTVDHIVELFKFPIVQLSVNILQPLLCFLFFIRIYLFIFLTS